MPRAVEDIDLAGFDTILSSSHAVAKGVVPPSSAVHVCYCHTPMRYVWDRYDDYFGPGRVSPPLRWLISLIAPRLRAWDVRTAARVHRFVANSAHVAERIRRYYGRESEVIHPPVDTDFFTPGPEGPGTYDLVVSALAPYKRIDLVLDAYRGSGRALKIAGSGPEQARLRASAQPGVEFLGHVDDIMLRELYRGCRAVLMPGVEDFGIVPLEAMACGRPAIVFADGGGRESVIPGETGLVFDKPTAEALRAAVDSLEGVRFNERALRQRAESYSRARFEARLKAFLDQALAEKHTRSC